MARAGALAHCQFRIVNGPPQRYAADMRRELPGFSVFVPGNTLATGYPRVPMAVIPTSLASTPEVP